jgi:hypothetical protein
MPATELNMACVDAMLYLAGILRLGESDKVPHPIDADSVDRIGQCLTLLGSPVDEEMLSAWLQGCRSSFAVMTEEKIATEGEGKEEGQVSLAPLSALAMCRLKRIPAHYLCYLWTHTHTHTHTHLCLRPMWRFVDARLNII